jgi:hypothetical protein
MSWSRRVAGLALCAVLACNDGDEPTSPAAPGASQAVTCPPDWLCSTNGTIHDGTGSGTLVSVTGDPSPGADGVWLGNLRSEQWCYRTYNPFIADDDFDWLDDECEFQLAKAFAPALAIHPNDGCPLGEPYWAAKFFSNIHFGTGDMVRIAYMPSYYNDCGDLRPFGLAGPHEGDSEIIVLGIHYNLATRHWEMKEIFLSAHHETFNSASLYTTDESTLEYPVRTRAYPRVWIAQKKHANYRDLHDCETRAVFDDNCDGNTTVGRIKVYQNNNVGSRFVDFLPNGVPSKNPAFSGNGRKEYFYTSQRFRGWQFTGEGATPYFTFLIAVRFECLDLNQIPGGMRYCGPDGDVVPGSTPVRAQLDGPASVTAQQSYTYTSFVTGGRIPYRAEWWRKYANEATAVKVGTSTGTYSGTGSTAGNFTMLVDRCQSFVLTLKVWDANNTLVTRTKNVSLASCPPPPLTVTISGPSSISVKATYTYTAVTSGFSSTSYAWSQRYCTATSCPGWTNLTGYTTSVPRVLTFNSTCTGETRYEIRVTVRNSDGRTVTATKQTALCAGGGGPLN